VSKLASLTYQKFVAELI